MIPLLICSVLSVALIIEKSIVLGARRVIPEGLLRIVNANPLDVDRISAFCEMHPGPCSSIIKTVLANRSFQKSANQENTQLEGKVQVNRMEKGLTALEVVSAIAPLLGLLGTVIGLVDVFQVISKTGAGQTTAFASGIAKALITTVAGLIIAIPSFIAYRYFAAKVENLVLAMEKEAGNLINRIYGI